MAGPATRGRVSPRLYSTMVAELLDRARLSWVVLPQAAGVEWPSSVLHVSLQLRGDQEAGWSRLLQDNDPRDHCGPSGLSLELTRHTSTPLSKANPLTASRAELGAVCHSSRLEADEEVRLTIQSSAGNFHVPTPTTGQTLHTHYHHFFPQSL